MNEYDLVVATDGNDSFSGKLADVNSEGTDGPLATIEKAKELLKEHKGKSHGEITVWLRGGKYFLNSDIAFTAEDCENVTFKGYPGEDVVITRSKPITGWTEEIVNGVKAWTKQLDKSSDNWYFSSLYSEKHTIRQTKYPENGYLTVKELSLEDATDTGKWEFTRQDRAFYGGDDLETTDFHNINDVCLRVLHYWTDEMTDVASISSDKKISYNIPSKMLINVGDRYYFENVFESLNEPGEWYLDSESAKLYYVPHENEDINSTVLYAANGTKFITADSAKNITFKNIGFRFSDWSYPPIDGTNNVKEVNCSQAAYDVNGAIEISDSDGFNFIDCRFNEIGNTAIKFVKNVKNSVVSGCRFENIGATGVFIKGENCIGDEEHICRNIKVTNNYICEYGRKFYNAIGVLLCFAKDSEISNNEIHDGYYSAISVGWNWGYSEHVTDSIKIKNNLIYNIGQGWLSDMGGIYTLGIQPNTVISGNVIHDVAADPGQGGYGGWGIYLDEGSSYILVEKNLVYSCSSEGFHQHYGENNMIRNNIFALNKDAQMRITREEDHNSLYFYNNILLSDEAPIYYKVKKGMFKDDKNIYWDLTLKEFVRSGDESLLKCKSRSAIKLMGYYNNGIFANPGFKDLANFDFTLAENSPAIKSGFETWDYTEAGTLCNFNK